MELAQEREGDFSGGGGFVAGLSAETSGVGVGEQNIEILAVGAREDALHVALGHGFGFRSEQGGTAGLESADGGDGRGVRVTSALGLRRRCLGRLHDGAGAAADENLGMSREVAGV